MKTSDIIFNIIFTPLMVVIGFLLGILIAIGAIIICPIKAVVDLWTEGDDEE